MIVSVIAISNLVLTQQIYSEETNGAHAHYREPVPLKHSTGVRKIISSCLSRVLDMLIKTFLFSSPSLKFTIFPYLSHSF